MTVILILGILFALGFLCYGIFLLFSHRWLPKFLMLMWDKSPEPSTALRIGIWKFRLLGIGNIMLAVALLIMTAVPSADASVLMYIAMAAFIINFILGLVAGVLISRNKKAERNKSH